MLQHDLTILVSPAAPVESSIRALGHAHGLSALLSLIPHRSLYVSFDISSNVFYTSVQLLKSAGEHEVPIARVEVEVAWTLIAALMSLGPHFVRAHLPQLLVLWRNSLPKPTSKDNLPERSPSEWMFLLQVRENALRAICAFLQHNASTLVTTDISRRIASLLSNALQFSQLFMSRRVEDTPEPAQPTKPKGFGLNDIEALLRRRIFRCFLLLDLPSLNESMHTSLLEITSSLFASTDGYVGSTVQAAIASSSGTFINIWQTVDGYAYGLMDLEINVIDPAKSFGGTQDWLNRDSVVASIDELVSLFLGAFAFLGLYSLNGISVASLSFGLSSMILWWCAIQNLEHPAIGGPKHPQRPPRW